MAWLFLCVSFLAIAQVANSPYMNLPIPLVGQTPGPEWANDINASLTLIDAHNHTPGNGVQIPPAGININTNFAFNNHSATNLQGTVFTPQVSFTTNYGVHVEGADLYYVDGNGNDVRITSGGGVNATSSGISSGTATASFSAGVLIVNAAANTPANIQAASYLMGNNTANSKYLTLSPPNAMASNYGLTFPSLPGSQSFMTIDTGGNMAGYAPISGGLTGSNIASQTVTGSNMVNATITATQIASATILGSNIAAATVAKTNQVAEGQQISSSCGAAATSSTSYVAVTNLSVTITTTGRPVMVFLQPDGISAAYLFTGAGGGSSYSVKRASTTIAEFSGNAGAANSPLPVSTISVLDTPAAGTYTYTVNYHGTSLGGSVNVQVNNAVLVAYEL